MGCLYFAFLIMFINDAINVTVSMEQRHKESKQSDSLLEEHELVSRSEIVTKKDGQVTEKWSKSCDFVLTLIGYIVGLANIWRFPYLCAKNGGAVFLIPYLIFMVLVAFPLCFLEISIGQFSGKRLFKVWDICPIFRGLGIGMTLVSAVYCTYANIILSWVLYYLVFSFMDPLPWTQCGQWWNTPTCMLYETIGGSNQTEVLSNSTYNISHSLMTLFVTNDTMGHINDTVFTNVNNNTNIGLSAPEEFWQYNVLRISTGIEDYGVPQWHIIVGSTVGWLITFLCIVKGVKTLGKVVYVTATFPYLLITILLIRALTLPGAIKGVEFYIIPDFSKLLDVQIWIKALLQVFFSFGTGCGGFISMASYNKFNSNVLRDTLICCFACVGTSFTAGFVVFAVLGHMANVTGLEVADLVRTGPGLAFVAYPAALSQLPMPQIWAVLFFLMLIMVALDCLFVTVEILTTFINEVLGNSSKNRMVLITGVTCFVMCIIATLYSTNAGVFVFQIIDWYATTVSVIIYALLECLIIGWIYGTDKFYIDLEMMFDKKPPIILKYMWRYITPMLMLAMIVCTFYNFAAPTYGSYVYPVEAEVLGWLVATLPVLAIPLWMLFDTMRKRGPILQRLKDGFKPNGEWGPAIDSGKFYNVNSQEMIGC